MKKQTVKRLMALLLGSAMCLSVMACGKQETEDSKQPESKEESKEESKDTQKEEEKEEAPLYTVREDGMPVAADGANISFSVGTVVANEVGPAEESWAYQFLTRNMNVEIEATQYTTGSAGEQIALAFASDDLPDVVFNAQLSSADMQKYGMVEGQLLNLAPYIEDGTMPNLKAALDAHPEFRAGVTQPDGGIYGLGMISNLNGGGAAARAFVNYKWLEELGLDVPKTLDDFLDAMRAMKDAGYCEYPIGGAASCESPFAYLLNAFGYINPWTGTSLCLRNGEVVYPAADREVFGEWLKMMNQIYEEGLIHADYFTVDNPSMWAVLAEDAGFMGQCPYVFSQNNNDYFAAYPLTSEWNETPQWYYNDWQAPKGNSLMVSADCENVEFVLKFIDWLYVDNGETFTYNGNILSHGYTGMKPEQLPEEALLGVECELNAAGQWVAKEFLENQEAYGSDWGYIQSKIYFAEQVGYNGASFADYKNTLDATFPDFPINETDEFALWKESIKCNDSTNNPNWNWVIGEQLIQAQYTTTEIFPVTIYMDADQLTELNDTKVALDEYANAEIARFITGEREVSDAELEDYFDTLDSMGAQDYVKAYADYYANLK